MTRLERWGAAGRQAWGAYPSLAGAVLVFAGLLVVSCLMLAVDGRAFGGQPVWLKPAKFAASSGIFCATLLWLLLSVDRPAWGMRGAGVVVAWALVLEVAVVTLQASRGTISHFNVGTPLDAGLWMAMGLGILVLLVALLFFAVGLIRSPVADRAWGWALRLGMVASVAGASLGQLMTSPTAAQRAELAATGRSAAIGGHTVGARDGGAGLPGVGWSRDHGDLRIPHFVGLHAVQAIPFLCWLAFRVLRPTHESTALALTVAVALSYSGLVALLAAQALSGRSLLHVDGPVLAALGIWLGLTVLGVGLAMGPERARLDRSIPLTAGA